MDLTPPVSLDLLESIVRDLNATVAEKGAAEALIASGLPPLVDTRVLSLVLGVSHKLLWAMASVPERYYRRFEIPKRSGGTRAIATPRVFLKVVQRWILENVLYKRSMPPFVTGFVPGGSVLANASFHVGHAYLAKIDIQDFLPSIGFDRVKTVYQSFGFPDKVILLLTKLSLLNGTLPQGAPTSPHIANLVFLPCDLQIVELAGRHGIAYSRYADDLTFSCEKPIDEDFIAQVVRFIADNSLRINPKKLKISGPGQRLITTGMVVNVAAHPLRQLRRQLRARFHQAAISPLAFDGQAHQLLGWAAYVKMYDSELGAKYLGIARNVLAISRSKDSSQA